MKFITSPEHALLDEFVIKMTFSGGSARKLNKVIYYDLSVEIVTSEENKLLLSLHIFSHG